MILQSIEQLKSLYSEPSGRALLKEQSALDAHSRRFIELSPFLVLSSSDSRGNCDASPRGGTAGFVLTHGEQELLLPDSPGNNRLDSLRNILETGRVGLLFLLPGIDETLRVNGRAQLSLEPETLALFKHQKRPPKLVIQVTIETLFMHCAKALMRSALWDPKRHLERSEFPTMGQILKDQTGSSDPPESHAEMCKRYAKDL